MQVSDGQPERTRPATLKDVAAATGVSVPTVSKVLNGIGTVSVETRIRIFEAVERLDFRPNALAKSFALGRSFTVGILAQKASGNFSSPVITGVINELSSHDIAVLVYDDENEPLSRPDNLRSLQARRVDGVVVVGDGTDIPFPSISEAFSCPVVHVFGVVRQSGRPLPPARRRTRRPAGWRTPRRAGSNPNRSRDGDGILRSSAGSISRPSVSA